MKSYFIEEKESAGGIMLLWVAEMDHKRHVVTYLSVHDKKDEAEAQLDLAKKGEHICQTNSAGTLWAMADD